MLLSSASASAAAVTAATVVAAVAHQLTNRSQLMENFVSDLNATRTRSQCRQRQQHRQQHSPGSHSTSSAEMQHTSCYTLAFMKTTIQ
jgi:hypothetical protein